MTQRDDHADLPAHAVRLIDRLESLQSLFVPARVGYEQHTKFAARSGELADHLSAAMLLSDARHYASALAILRTALEHHLADRLLFLANRYLQIYPVKKVAIAAEEARLSSLKSGPRPDIVRWRMTDGKMNVIVKGLYPTGSLGRGSTLSPYYFVGDHYDPFTGRPRNVHLLAGAFQPIGERRKWAEESKNVWESLFVYSKLRRNLLLNGLVTNKQALQIDVHYGFLSAYTHAIERAYELVYGRNIPSRRGAHDHYSSELVLLYVITIATEELLCFRRTTSRAPRLGLRDWNDVTDEIAAARLEASHMWFLWGDPLMLDRINEVHTRLARWRSRTPLRTIDPSTLRADQVRYYTNPLKRLVELHRGGRELTTGLGGSAMFPRPDAINRV